MSQILEITVADMLTRLLCSLVLHFTNNFDKAISLLFLFMADSSRIEFFLLCTIKMMGDVIKRISSNRWQISFCYC
jgi:hypothetical protein